MEKTATCYNPHIELMPRERIKNLQLDLLRRQLYYVFNSSEFFNQKCKNANVAPDDVTKLEELKKIPVTTREDIENYIDKTRDPYGGTTCIKEPRREGITGWRILRDTTPPTKPIQTTITRPDFFNLTELWARQWVMIGIGKGDFIMVQNDEIIGDHVSMVSSAFSSWRPDVHRILGCVIPLTTMGPPLMELPRMVQCSRLFNISAVFSTLSFLSGMEEICKREGISPKDFKYRSIVARDRKAIAKDAKDKLRETWGTKIQTMLFIPENMFYAQDCSEEEGLHVWEDMFIVEALDGNNEPVEAGKVGKLTITNLFSEGSPLIRYKTDVDVILNEEVCKCGRTHLRIIPS
jgi:phenylacetate-CoA ligase